MHGISSRGLGTTRQEPKSGFWRWFFKLTNNKPDSLYAKVGKRTVICNFIVMEMSEVKPPNKNKQ